MGYHAKFVLRVLRAKLLRTSSEVAANVERSCCKPRAKLLRTSSEVAANL